MNQSYKIQTKLDQTEPNQERATVESATDDALFDIWRTEVVAKKNNMPFEAKGLGNLRHMEACARKGSGCGQCMEACMIADGCEISLAGKESNDAHDGGGSVDDGLLKSG